MTEPQWEVFRGRRAKREQLSSQTPTVRFARGGTIVFNAPAAQRLGDYVEFLFSGTHLGFRPAKDDNPNAYRLRRTGRQKTVTAVVFCRETGHSRSESVTYPATWDDGFLVIERSAS